MVWAPKSLQEVESSPSQRVVIHQMESLILRGQTIWWQRRTSILFRAHQASTFRLVFQSRHWTTKCHSNLKRYLLSQNIDITLMTAILMRLLTRLKIHTGNAWTSFVIKQMSLTSTLHHRISLVGQIRRITVQMEIMLLSLHTTTQNNFT